MARPLGYRDKHERFLDSLRSSGKVNMFGAAPHLEEAFGLSAAKARRFLAFWMTAEK